MERPGRCTRSGGSGGVFLLSLVIIFASVVDQVKADQCVDGLGTCESCDQRCKAKHGPSSQGSCDRTFSTPLCNCFYTCGPPPSPPPPKTCNGGAGLCSQNCPENCCNTNCGQKFPGGRGFCNTLGTSSLCQCEYPC